MVEVFVATYERYVMGYKLALQSNKDDDDEKSSVAKLELSFRIHSAVNSLRCMATNGKVLACGSTDEAIYLYDVINRKEMGPVRFHAATVNCVDMYKQKIMVSGAEDGSLCLWDCDGSNYSLLKQFRIKHAILSVSIEPTTGKVALTTDARGYLKVWDLFSCVLAYSLPLKFKPHTVLWSRCGLQDSNLNSKVDRFALLSDNFLDIRNLNDGESLSSFKIDNCGILTCVKFITDELLIVSTSQGHLILASLNDSRTVELRNAHNTRIKGLSVQRISNDSSNYFVFSGSSDGYVKVWSLNTDQEPLDLCFVTLTNVKCRITSLESNLFVDS